MGLLGGILNVICGESTKEDIDYKIASLMAQKRNCKEQYQKNYIQSQIDSLRVKKRYMKK